MLNHLRIALVSLIVFAALASPACAWDDFGHMAVAYLAYQQLTPTARDRANALLKLNPYYSRWAAAIPPDLDKDLVIFMFASLWPDEIRFDPAFISDGSSDGNRPDGSPDPNRNTGYDDNFRHKYRHFIDRPFSTDGTPTGSFQIPTPNAQDSIALFRTVLASADSDPKKSYDLTWLLHLVGDIHQPLHACTRLTAALPQGDDGGNKVVLHCSDCAPRLHAFWDDALGTTTKLSSPPEQKGFPDADSIRRIIAVARKLRRPNRRLAAKSGEAVWVQESFEAAQRKVYPRLISNPDGSFSVSASYRRATESLAKKRVALAAARLAHLLNSELR